MLSAGNSRSTDIKHRYFERHKSTGRDTFSLLICLDAIKLVLLSVFILLAKPLSKTVKSPPRCVCSEASFLKLVGSSYSKKIQIQDLVMMT